MYMLESCCIASQPSVVRLREAYPRSCRRRIEFRVERANRAGISVSLLMRTHMSSLLTCEIVHDHHTEPGQYRVEVKRGGDAAWRITAPFIDACLRGLSLWRLRRPTVSCPQLTQYCRILLGLIAHCWRVALKMAACSSCAASDGQY